MMFNTATQLTSIHEVPRSFGLFKSARGGMKNYLSLRQKKKKNKQILNIYYCM